MFRIMGNRTPTRIRALGVHRVKEIGKGAAAFYVSVLEQELCAPCPQFSPSVAFELLLTVAHTAKLVQVRDLGRKNVGSRRRDSGQMGEPPKDAILLVDANYWQQYKTGSRPHWPNRQRAQLSSDFHSGLGSEGPGVGAPVPCRLGIPYHFPVQSHGCLAGRG